MDVPLAVTVKRYRLSIFGLLIAFVIGVSNLLAWYHHAEHSGGLGHVEETCSTCSAHAAFKIWPATVTFESAEPQTCEAPPQER